MWIKGTLGAIRVKRIHGLAEKGYWMEGYWDKGCPSPRDPDQIRYTWADHLYMLRHSELPTIYVSEPYDLDGDDFGEMAKLVDDGWDVRIVPHKSLWNPGSTIPIWMSREVD
jgi:hypothetical protein